MHLSEYIDVLQKTDSSQLMKSLYFSKFLEITGFTSAECILHLISTVDSFVHTLSEENSLDRSDLWVFHKQLRPVLREQTRNLCFSPHAVKV